MTSPTRSPRLDINEHATAALRLIAVYGWLRATELGRLMYGPDVHSRKYAEQHLRKLYALRLLLPRPLPGRHAGTAYVLSQRGADQLNTWSSDGGGYRTGKAWGRNTPEGWHPPASWQHDLLAIGVLSHLASQGAEVLPERLLRAHAPDAEKHPDGIAIFPDFSVWLEVENSRKTGSQLDQTLSAIVNASRSQPIQSYDAVQHAPVSRGLIAIDPQATDERGYRLNHWARIEARIKQVGLRTPVTIGIAWMNLRGIGVESIELEDVSLS